MNNLYLANSTRDDLDAFAAILPNTFETDNDFRAAQLALLAYQSGLCVATQLELEVSTPTRRMTMIISSIWKTH